MTRYLSTDVGIREYRKNYEQQVNIKICVISLNLVDHSLLVWRECPDMNSLAEKYLPLAFCALEEIERLSRSSEDEEEYEEVLCEENKYLVLDCQFHYYSHSGDLCCFHKDLREGILQYKKALEVVERSRKNPKDFDENMSLCLKLIHTMNEADIGPSEMIEALEMVYGIYCEAKGPADPQLQGVVVRLASEYAALGDFDKAEECGRIALDNVKMHCEDESRRGLLEADASKSLAVTLLTKVQAKGRTWIPFTESRAVAAIYDEIEALYKRSIELTDVGDDDFTTLPTETMTSFASLLSGLTYVLYMRPTNCILEATCLVEREIKLSRNIPGQRAQLTLYNSLRKLVYFLFVDIYSCLSIRRILSVGLFLTCSMIYSLLTSVVQVVGELMRMREIPVIKGQLLASMKGVSSKSPAHITD